MQRAVCLTIFASIISGHVQLQCCDGRKLEIKSANFFFPDFCYSATVDLAVVREHEPAKKRWSDFSLLNFVYYHGCVSGHAVPGLSRQAGLALELAVPFWQEIDDD